MSVIKFPVQAQPPRPRPIDEIVPEQAKDRYERRPEPAAPFLDEVQTKALISRPMAVGDSVAVIDPANRSLLVAQQHDFYALCEPVLWGAERTGRNELFGELLRSTVMTFLPDGLHDLFQLKAVVAAQWRLNRLLEIQSNLFSAHAESQEHDRRGIPRATTHALEIDRQIDQAQVAVLRAIESYYTGKRASRREAG
jgi:hypothetical protein